MPSLSGASIGSGVLSVWKENPENARDFQREMFDKKQNAERLDAEKKNWQLLDNSKIDPLYQKDVSNAFAQFSLWMNDKLKEDPSGKFIGTIEYQQKWQPVKQLYKNALEGTKNIQLEDELAYKEPSHFLPKAAVMEARKKGDLQAFIALNGGDPVYRPGSGRDPNVDIEKTREYFLKTYRPTETPKYGGPIGQGKQVFNTTSSRTPEQIAEMATVLQHDPVWGNLYKPDEILSMVKSWADNDAKAVQGKVMDAPDVQTGYGGVPKGWTESVAEPKTITLSSGVAGKGVNKYEDATGKSYPEVETVMIKNKPVLVAKGTKTIVYPKKSVLNVTTSEYYPLKGAPVQTSSDLIIDGTTGIQKKIGGSKAYDISGIAKVDYVISPDGTAVIASDEGKKNFVSNAGVKTDYFAEVMEKTGLKDGTQIQKPYLIKINPDILAAAEKAKIKLPNEVKAAVKMDKSINIKQDNSIPKINSQSDWDSAPKGSQVMILKNGNWIQVTKK